MSVLTVQRAWRIMDAWGANAVVGGGGGWQQQRRGGGGVLIEESE